MNNLPGLTIVTPSFEKHAVQYGNFLASLAEHCLDLDFIKLIVIVEESNRLLFEQLIGRFPQLDVSLQTTEAVLAGFEINETPGRFLSRVGKFSFQTLKKFGGLKAATTEWSLVMDSETLFHKPFTARTLLDDYVERKYVFYTQTEPRGKVWKSSLGFKVTKNCAAALGIPAPSRWYMEYFHWFYDRQVVEALLRGAGFKRLLASLRATTQHLDYFENIFYYLFLQQERAEEYQFIDFKAALDAHVPSEIAQRFALEELPFSLFGNEYLLNILQPEEIGALAPLFEHYRLPFVRLEPPFIDHRYLIELKKLPHFVATISSHHIMWLKGRVAVCISGEFRHSVHRTPEHHLRHILGFLSGVDCDIFLHGWANSSEALILNELKPKAWIFEPKRSFDTLADKITTIEKKLKPGRDAGSLSMFYGIQRCVELVEQQDESYDYIVRLRPDMFSNSSLKELMFTISDNGDLLPEAIYIPRSFQSKGMNDQFALGPAALMSVYGHTFDFAEQKISELAFNPEMVLLQNLLENEIQIALLDMPYALMREEPMRIDSVHHKLHSQEGVWWSRTPHLPSLTDVSGYFRDKLRSAQSILQETTPAVLVLRPKTGNAKRELFNMRVWDYNPALGGVAFIRRLGVYWPKRLSLGAGGLPGTVSRSYFAYKQGEEWILSEWRYDNKSLTNVSVKCLEENAKHMPLSYQIGLVAYTCGRLLHVVMHDVKSVLRRLRNIARRYRNLLRGEGQS